MTRWTKIYLMVAGLLAAPAIASAEMSAHDRLASWMQGSFSNSAQMTSASTEDTDGNPATAPLSVRHAHLYQFEADLGGTAFYLQWNDGMGRVARQRLWVLREHGDQLFLDFYSLRQPAHFRDAYLFPEKLSKEARIVDWLALVVGYPEACLLPVRPDGPDAYVAEIPETCWITAQRSGRRMQLRARIRFTENGFSYQEQGLLEDGSTVFHVPAPAPFEFEKVSGGQSLTPDEALAGISALLPGSYDNAAQHAASAEAEEPYGILPQIIARIEAPQLGTHVFYHQIWSDAEKTKIYRQRILVLQADTARDAVVQRSYMIADAAQYGDGHLRPEIFAALKPEQLSRLGEGCELVWRGSAPRFAGRILPGACRIDSRREPGTQRLILAENALTPEALTSLEWGLTLEGDWIFGRKDMQPYNSKRILETSP